MSEKTSPRAVKKIWTSQPTIDGAGVHLRRAFGYHQVPEFDPFLLLDDFRSNNPADYLAGFPWHPHRGIETITYVLDGDVEHEDSLGNGGVISSGDIQWMTAGSGILHQEMPKGDTKGRMDGFQLWANLPAKSKMTDPKYRDVKSGQVPVAKTKDGAAVRVIAGTVEGVQGPVQDIAAGPEYLDVAVPAGKVFTHPVEPGQTVFAYVIEGQGFFEPGHDAKDKGSVQTAVSVPELLGSATLILYGPGDTIVVTTQNTPVRFLLASGKPLREPVAWAGPIVMNTKDELRTAFEEFDKGTFVKRSGTH